MLVPLRPAKNLPTVSTESYTVQVPDPNHPKAKPSTPNPEPQNHKSKAPNPKPYARFRVQGLGCSVHPKP